MNVSLTRELEEYVDGKVRSGLYQTASEVIREALRLLQEHEHQKLHLLRQSIEAGVKEIERGEYIDYDGDKLRRMFEEVKTQGRRRLSRARQVRSR